MRRKLAPVALTVPKPPGLSTAGKSKFGRNICESPLWLPLPYRHWLQSAPQSSVSAATVRSSPSSISARRHYRDTVGQIRQLRELGINVKMFAAPIGPGIPNFVEELGSTAEYVVGSSSWEPKLVLGHPGMKEFIDSYEKRYGVKPNYHAGSGHAGMQIFTAAIKQAGSFDPEKVRDALASITVQTIRGPWKANDQGLGLFDPVTIQIQKGKRVLVWPAHQAEARFLLMPKWEDRAKK